MEVQRIKSLDELKAWNQNPTEQKPIVMEWFFDWFFEEVLMKDNLELAKDAYMTMIEFCSRCEGMSLEDSQERTLNNLKYYSGYAAQWEAKLMKYVLDLKF